MHYGCRRRLLGGHRRAPFAFWPSADRKWPKGVSSVLPSLPESRDAPPGPRSVCLWVGGVLAPGWRHPGAPKRVLFHLLELKWKGFAFGGGLVYQFRIFLFRALVCEHRMRTCLPAPLQCESAARGSG